MERGGKYSKRGMHMSEEGSANTDKNTQIYAKTGRNRRKSVNIWVYIQIYGGKSGYISGYGTLFRSENRVCDAENRTSYP